MQPALGGVTLSQVSAAGDISLRIGFSEERFQQLSEEFGITRAALKSFFKLIAEQHVPVEDLDHTLREIASRYNELRQQLQSFTSDDAEETALKQQAAQALDLGELDRAEAALNAASDRAVAIARELQELSQTRLLSAAATKVQIGDLKYTEWAYADAATYYEQAVSLVPPTMTALVAQYLNKAGSAYGRAGNLAKAEELFSRAVSACEVNRDSSHPQLLSALRNLARVHADLGHTAQAETLYKRALSIVDRDPSNWRAVSEMLNNLGVLCDATGRFSEAEDYYLECASIVEASVGPEHPELAQTLYNIGLLYERLGRPEADSMFERALLIRKNSVGPNDPNFLDTIQSLADLYARRERYDDAAQLLALVLSIKESLLGNSHVDVAEVLVRLAAVYSAQGLLAQADQALVRAQPMYESVYGPRHRLIAMTLYRRAQLIDSAEGSDRKLELLEQALAIAEGVIGENHPDTAAVLRAVADLQVERQRIDLAVAPLARLVSINEQIYGAEDQRVATPLNDLAVMLVMQRRFAEAEPLLRRALAIEERYSAPDDPAVAKPLRNLAKVLRLMGQVSDAEALEARAGAFA